MQGPRWASTAGRPQAHEARGVDDSQTAPHDTDSDRLRPSPRSRDGQRCGGCGAPMREVPMVEAEAVLGWGNSRTGDARVNGQTLHSRRPGDDGQQNLGRRAGARRRRELRPIPRALGTPLDVTGRDRFVQEESRDVGPASHPLEVRLVRVVPGIEQELLAAKPQEAIGAVVDENVGVDGALVTAVHHVGGRHEWEIDVRGSLPTIGRVRRECRNSPKRLQGGRRSHAAAASIVRGLSRSR